MTVKLYEASPQLEFTATVETCQPGKDGYEVVLDKTAFFPEGGGQPCDRGTLNGLPVTEVHIQEGIITHRMGQPLEPGTMVTGVVDAARRLDHAQQHTGEHILSGTLFRLYGAQNVGFHIGSPWVRMDMDKPLTADQLAQAEAQANAVIWQNAPVQAFYPTPAELAELTYRSKKELEGPVRIVDIPGADRCACCGTHLSSTGAVGIIKIVSAQNYKGGVRLAVACGKRAYDLLAAEHDQILAMSGLFSAKPELVEEAARRMAGENLNLKTARANLTTRLIQSLGEAADPTKPHLALYEGFDGDGLRRLANEVGKYSSQLCGVFAPTAQNLSYVLAYPGQDVRPIAKALNQQFGGRGGGSAALCQGSLPCGEFKQIKTFLEEFTTHENEI